ncbi:MAG: GNAT family N-acetyltransferase [Flavobacteriales bacterium]|jgi:diamine N-acetyltransferase|nr:GNAT family N-acetyltransferase [Flavobacteriales bacterium]
MLKGEKIRLRALEPADIDLLYEWENNADIWRISDSNAPFSRNILEQYINTAPDIYLQRQMRVVVELRGKPAKPIGCIDLFDFDPHHRRIGLGILIADKSERRKGYATEALQLVLQYCFGFLACHQVYCNIEADNPASLGLFKNLKFVVSGHKKEWVRHGNTFRDELFLQCFNQA